MTKQIIKIYLFQIFFLKKTILKKVQPSTYLDLPLKKVKAGTEQVIVIRQLLSFGFGIGIGFGIGMFHLSVSVSVALLPIPKLPKFRFRQKL